MWLITYYTRYSHSFRYDGRFKDSFERSIKMSTYLVAFIVSDYDSVSRANQAVYARNEMIEDGRGDYALDIGITTLEAIEQFTNIEYKLTKMYQAAIPDSYFTFGAMENWGLVTYRYLYFDMVSTSRALSVLQSFWAVVLD